MIPIQIEMWVKISDAVEAFMEAAHKKDLVEVLLKAYNDNKELDEGTVSRKCMNA